MSDAQKNTLLAHLKYIQTALDMPLARHTTFRIGGLASFFVEAQTEEQLQQTMDAALRCDLPFLILGGGSNVLISDQGFHGVVTQLGGELAQIHVDSEQGIVEVGAGASFPMLTKKSLQVGIASAVGWHGTPGQVGGALKMNAGSKQWGEIGQAVIDVRGISSSSTRIFQQSDAGFTYRNSAFPSEYVLTKARLTCAHLQDPKALQEQVQQLTQRRKQTQPKQPSAGSFFKNPKNDYAGRLIEACGLKETRVGGAQVSSVHANFIINHQHATANDVYSLSETVRETVYQRFHVLLENEVKLVGEFIRKL